jgi:hypothetical protein
MNSLVDRLPARFPVGTRYVIEGRRQADGGLRISMRCLEFPDGRQVRLPSDKAPTARRIRRRPGRSATRRK